MSEVPLHVLGDSIASSAVAVQRDLCSYRTECGGFVLDELDLIVPVIVRLDALGQLMASIPEPNVPTAGQLRLRVKFATADGPPQVTSGRPLRELALLPDDIDLLEKMQLFTVEDLLRIGRNVAGIRALERLTTALPIRQILGRAELSAVGAPRRLFEIVGRLEAFIAAEAEKYATELAVPIDDVRRWQNCARDFLRAFEVPTNVNP